jgi:uncharacterized protein
MSAPQARLLPDGRRLHLQHGPIDLVIEAWGEPAETVAAYDQARAAFTGLLDGLVAELAMLKRPLAGRRPAPRGLVARRMVAATWPYRRHFITPMAAVAGSVADHILEALVRGRRLRKAYVNDGGDIGFHLGAGESLTCGLVSDPSLSAIDGRIMLECAGAARGIATSGAPTKGNGGRSFSLGIADAVSVLARCAAEADAAATIIANAVDLPGHPAIRRVPAESLDPESDLGARLVTVGVGALSPADIACALGQGRKVAAELCAAGSIVAAALVLRGRMDVAGPVPLLSRAA